MVRLREVPRTATFAWSPGSAPPLLATGTRAGAVDADFSNETQLEIWDLDLDNTEKNGELQPVGSVSVDSRYIITHLAGSLSQNADLCLELGSTISHGANQTRHKQGASSPAVLKMAQLICGTLRSCKAGLGEHKWYCHAHWFQANILEANRVSHEPRSTAAQSRVFSLTLLSTSSLRRRVLRASCTSQTSATLRTLSDWAHRQQEQMTLRHWIGIRRCHIYLPLAAAEALSLCGI